MDKQLLEQEAEEYAKQFKHGGDYRKLGFIDAHTQSSTVKELEREVERLKGLWNDRFNNNGFKGFPFNTPTWQQFKTENQL